MTYVSHLSLLSCPSARERERERERERYMYDNNDK
tara:strand:- start:7014 stop:7118 length:105 start_codon:yes stop_codon:yes gene_type:complete